MASNPLISLKTQTPNIAGTFQNVLTTLQGIESLKQAPMKNRLLQAQTQQAEAQAGTSRQQAFDEATKSRVAGIAGMAQEAIPALQNGDMAGARAAVLARVEQAQRAGLPMDEWQEAMTLLESDPATFMQRGQQAIDLHQRMNPSDTKYQFGSTDTVKDEAGNLFTVVPRNNPTTGATETNLSPVGHSNQPQGKLSRVSSLGLTAQEQVQQKAKEAAATSGAEFEQKIKYAPMIEKSVVEARKLAEKKGEAFTELNQMEAALPGLQEAVSNLKSLAPIATHTLVGRGFNTLAKEMGFGATEGATARAKFISIIDNQVLPLLKPTFGAAFTVQEGENLKATMGDPNKSPSEKMAALDAFIAQKERDIRTKKSEIKGLDAMQPSTAQPAGLQPTVIDWNDL